MWKISAHYFQFCSVTILGFPASQLQFARQVILNSFILRVLFIFKICEAPAPVYFHAVDRPQNLHSPEYSANTIHKVSHVTVVSLAHNHTMPTHLWGKVRRCTVGKPLTQSSLTLILILSGTRYVGMTLLDPAKYTGMELFHLWRELWIVCVAEPYAGEFKESDSQLLQYHRETDKSA